MSSEFLRRKIDKIDDEALKKKAAAVYVSELADVNRDVLARFFPDLDPQSDGFTKKAYELIEKIIEGIDAKYTRSFGVTLQYIKEGETPKPLSMSLGWTKFVKAAPDDGRSYPMGFPHVLIPTQQGISVVDGYRKALGCVTMKEQALINRKSWDDAIATANRQ